MGSTKKAGNIMKAFYVLPNMCHFCVSMPFPLSLWCLSPVTAVVITGHARLDLYTLSPREDIFFVQALDNPSAHVINKVRRLASGCPPSVCHNSLTFSSVSLGLRLSVTSHFFSHPSSLYQTGIP